MATVAAGRPSPHFAALLETWLEGHRRAGWWAASVAPAVVLGGLALARSIGVPGLPAFPIFVAWLVVLAAAVTDSVSGKIYNWLTYPAFAWGIGFAALADWTVPVGSGLGSIGLERAALGALVGLIVMVLVHDLTGGGRGDLKLMVGLGSLLGPQPTLAVILLGYALAGLAVLAGTIRQHGALPVVGSYGKVIARLILPRWLAPALAESEQLLMEQRVRLGAYTAAATALVLLDPWGLVSGLGLLPAGGGA